MKNRVDYLTGIFKLRLDEPRISIMVDRRDSSSCNFIIQDFKNEKLREYLIDEFMIFCWFGRYEEKEHELKFEINTSKQFEDSDNFFDYAAMVLKHKYNCKLI